MTSPMAVKPLFPRQRDLDRAACLHREFRDSDVVTERIAFAAESSTIRTCNDLYPLCGHFQNTRKRAVNVMRRLRGGPERKLAVRMPARDGGMLFHRKMRVALAKKSVLEHKVRFA